MTENSNLPGHLRGRKRECGSIGCASLPGEAEIGRRRAIKGSDVSFEISFFSFSGKNTLYPIGGAVVEAGLGNHDGDHVPYHLSRV